MEDMARVSAQEVPDEDLPAPEQAEILSQKILAPIGGKVRILPVRTIAQEREWMDLVQEKAGSLGEAPLDLTPMGYTSLMRLGSDVILDLVIGYDLTNSLGGREYVEANGTRREIYSIFRRLLEEHFPFTGDLGDVLTRLQGVQGLLALTRSVQPNSESGSSPSGNRASRRSKRG